MATQQANRDRDLLAEGYPIVITHDVDEHGRAQAPFGGPMFSSMLLRRLWTRGGVPLATLEPIACGGNPRGKKWRSTWDLHTGREISRAGLYGQICFWPVARSRGVLVLGDLRELLLTPRAKSSKVLALPGRGYELVYVNDGEHGRVLYETHRSRKKSEDLARVRAEQETAKDA